MARSFKQRGTVVVSLAESPIPMVEVESNDNPAIFSETIAGEGNITGLSVYGKSTQDGTPSPENPVPIVSAGEKGSIKLIVTGKNLASCGDQNFIRLKNVNLTTPIPAGNYVFSANVQTDATTENCLINMLDADGNLIVSIYVPVGSNQSKAFAASRPVYTLSMFAASSNVTAIGYEATISNIQIEASSAATPYEPYTSQSLILSTPNGLPGIPVDSGGNYTDASGQQSACDVKDYGTGKYTQMVGHIESYNGESITTPYMSTTGQLSTGAEVYYVLDEPAVTDISADELAAYRALQTYDGTTVISVNFDPIAPGVKTTVKVIDPNSGNPQIMRLWLDKEGSPVNINGRGARVGGTPTQQYILQPCSF